MTSNNIQKHQTSSNDIQQNPASSNDTQQHPMPSNKIQRNPSGDAVWGEGHVMQHHTPVPVPLETCVYCTAQPSPRSMLLASVLHANVLLRCAMSLLFMYPCDVLSRFVYHLRQNSRTTQNHPAPPSNGFQHHPAACNTIQHHHQTAFNTFQQHPTPQQQCMVLQVLLNAVGQISLHCICHTHLARS